MVRVHPQNVQLLNVQLQNIQLPKVQISKRRFILQTYNNCRPHSLPTFPSVLGPFLLKTIHVSPVPAQFVKRYTFSTFTNYHYPCFEPTPPPPHPHGTLPMARPSLFHLYFCRLADSKVFSRQMAPNITVL